MNICDNKFLIKRNLSNCICIYAIDCKTYKNRFKKLIFDNND